MSVDIKAEDWRSRILPSLTYGAQTWALTKGNINKLRGTQNSMERNMLRIKKMDKIKISENRAKTNLRDNGGYVKTLKLGYAGHIWRDNNRWGKKIEGWTPWDMKRKRG